MGYEIIPGDCLPTLRGMAENSVDLIATDPPYAISDAHRKGNSLFEVLAKIGFPQFAKDVASGNGGAATGLVPFNEAETLLAASGPRRNARVNVASSVVDFEEHVQFGQEEVCDIPATALGIVEGELPAVCDAEGGQCLGYFVLQFGTLEEGSVRDPQGRTAAGFFPGGFWYHVRLTDHTLCQSETATSVVALAGTELPSVLSLDCTGGSAELLPADGTGEPDRDLLLACPQLVRASTAAGGLATPLQALRVGIVDRSTNRTGALHFHLLVPPDIWTSLRPIIAHKGFMGKTWDGTLPNPQVWRECLRVLKPGGSAVVMSGSRLDCLWRMCRDLEAAGFELSQTALYWCYRSGFPKGGDLSKSADRAAGAEREVVSIGDRRSDFDGCKRTSQAVNHNWRASEGRTDYADVATRVVTAPATELAVTLDGWFTKGKVKPAVEVIIWARKPVSEKTELANMARWGVGGVNCGACMVPFGEGGHPAEMYGESYMRSGTSKPEAVAGESHLKFAHLQHSTCADRINPAGRYPANLLCLGGEPLGEGTKYFNVELWAEQHGYTEDGWAEAAAAGLLQVAKPSKSEKSAGLDEFLKVHRECIQQRKNNGSGGLLNGTGTVLPQVNPHPTCKPVRLFAYLIEFLCPRLTPDGKPALVVDPFCGSGTTGVAAIQSGREFIGCEMEPEYVKIIEARCAHAAAPVEEKQPELDAQLTLT